MYIVHTTLLHNR